MLLDPVTLVKQVTLLIPVAETGTLVMLNRTIIHSDAVISSNTSTAGKTTRSSRRDRPNKYVI